MKSPTALFVALTFTAADEQFAYEHGLAGKLMATDWSDPHDWDYCPALAAAWTRGRDRWMAQAPARANMAAFKART